MADKDFIIKNGLVANGIVVANSTQISLGSNIVINTSAVFIGNATSNAYVSTGGLYVNGSLFVGVNTSQAYVFSNTITFGNTIVNSAINATSLFVGNSTVSTTISRDSLQVNTAFIVASNGFVGIGTTSPLATLDVRGTFNDAGANVLSQSLTDASTIAWNTSLGRIATVTLGASRIMGAPTNLKVGTYILNIIQGGSGSYNITWNGVFKWTSGVAPPLSTSVGARDIFSFVCDGTNMYGSFLPDVR